MCVFVLSLILAANADAARVYAVGGGVKAPVVVSRREVDFRRCDLGARQVTGMPAAEVIVNAKGKVASARLRKGVDPCLDRLFLSSLRSWTFQPGTLNGKPVAVGPDELHPHDSLPLT